jgi:hypothetical protein
MKIYHEEFPQDPLSEMLKQAPLEQPSKNFTDRVMYQIQTMEVENHVYFYQRPAVIGFVSVAFAACFLLFYNAGFSFSVLLKQLGNYYTFVQNYVATLSFIPRQITFSPIIIAPLLLIACIFIADRALETYKKQKQHQVFCI